MRMMPDTTTIRNIPVVQHVTDRFQGCIVSWGLFMPDQEHAKNYTSQARNQGHVAYNLNGRSPAATINSANIEKPNIDAE